MRYIIYTILLGYLLSLNGVLFGQLDKQRFEEIFEEETTEDKYSERENHSSLYIHTSPQSLPNWFYNPPTASGGEVIALGISDPGLDSADAVNMAVYRAQIMAQLLHKSTTQLMVDYFMNEQTGAQEVVYEHFSRVFTKTSDSLSNWEILKTYENEFNEVFVLIKYSPGMDNDIMKRHLAFLELFRNEIQVGGHSEYESVYEMLVKDNLNKSIPLMYRVTEFGQRSDVEGILNDAEYSLPIFSLGYNCETPDTVKRMHFSHGIWKEYIKSVTEQILEVARNKPSSIKDMGENYQPENYEKLTRGISVSRLRFQWQGTQLNLNQLQVKLSEVPLE